jgi:hypothetical protein
LTMLPLAVRRGSGLPSFCCPEGATDGRAALLLARQGQCGHILSRGWAPRDQFDHWPHRNRRGPHDRRAERTGGQCEPSPARHFAPDVRVMPYVASAQRSPGSITHSPPVYPCIDRVRLCARHRLHRGPRWHRPPHQELAKRPYQRVDAIRRVSLAGQPTDHLILELAEDVA